ncbi:hypothetical protein EES39_38220 [Streptomyces sp. ADI92-24]|nr:hypothetical protein EES39_38220 [Streptomyces sp. ADI92-24]
MFPLTRVALAAHGLADRSQAHEQGRCAQVYASQNPAPVRAAAPRAQEIAAR